MDTALGVTFKDFVILAADKTENMSIIKLSEEGSKIHRLTTHVAMTVTGEPGDDDQFSKFVQCNFELEKFRDDGWEVTLNRAYHWITWELAQSIRSRSPYSVFPILGGYDLKEQCGKVYWLDYMGAGVEVMYGAHGYGESFAIGYLDRHHRYEMNREQAVELVKEAINAIQTRLILSQSKFELKLIDKDGVHDLPTYVVDRTKTSPK